MIMLFYATIAVAFLILVLGLLGKTRSHEPEERISLDHSVPNIANGRWLDLSERIFDPSDARWLQDELAFPALAKSLELGRKRLAIQWLKALQAAFDEVVRTPGLTSSEAPEAGPASGWQMLWLTIRFNFLVSYALLVVRLFGPYNHLIPSFSWVPSSPGSEHSFRRASLAHSRNSR